MKSHTVPMRLANCVLFISRFPIRLTALTTSTILALTLTQAMTAEPITITAISPALAVGGLGWAVGSFIRGARADALSNADGTQVHDGPYGGWFSSDAHANAPAFGGKGSKLTTDADTAYLGIGKSRVTFPVAVVGSKPGASIYGYGYAAGGVSQDEKSIQGPRGTPKTGHRGSLQNRPTITIIQDVDSDPRVATLGQCEQCLERRKETTSYRVRAAGLVDAKD